MSDIATFYVEGGGKSTDGKAALRTGLRQFLAPLFDSAREKRLSMKIVMCGGRDAAFGRYQAARAVEPGLSVLLVDSEDPVEGGVVAHLTRRDGWALPASASGSVFMMVQVMETWIIADREALSTYYGNGFHAGSLPVNANLENVSKADISRALAAATRRTTKKEYHKIRDGSLLLARVNAGVVRAACPACDDLFKSLESLIASS